MRDTLDAVKAALERQHGKPVYFPFARFPNDVRATQGYLWKMPAELVAALPKLAAAAAGTPTTTPLLPPPYEPVFELGEDYENVNEDTQQGERDPFSVDPAVVERGLNSHRRLQNLLAHRVRDLGYTPKRPTVGNPLWDLLWETEDSTWVAEVKSITEKNEERQLRLGLGQLLRYRHRLSTDAVDARAALMIERGPIDPEWDALCAALNVVLVWPDVLNERVT